MITMLSSIDCTHKLGILDGFFSIYLDILACGRYSDHSVFSFPNQYQCWHGICNQMAGIDSKELIMNIPLHLSEYPKGLHTNAAVIAEEWYWESMTSVGISKHEAWFILNGFI